MKLIHSVFKLTKVKKYRIVHPSQPQIIGTLHLD
jgi:hypothetical protein